MNLTYQTTGGLTRTIENIGEGTVADNKSYVSYTAANGKTYHLFSVSIIGGKLYKDVVTVETARNWCKPLGHSYVYTEK